MTKAIAGLPYTVVPGDTLSGIAKQAYGRASKWRDIYAANQSNLRSGDPNLIFPGEVLNIPADDTVEEAKAELLDGEVLPTISGKDPNDFTVVVDGLEIPMMSGRLIRAMDTAADGWTSSLFWDLDNSELTSVLKPYQYNKSLVYLGGTQYINSYLYTIEPGLSPNGRVMGLEGWSITADIVDSTLKPPYEQNKINLEDRVKGIVKPFGITVKSNLVSDEIFDRVTAEPEDQIFEHLAGLAAQRGALISSNPLGELVLDTANTDSEPVGTIQESFPPFRNAKIRFDGRKRFNVYKAIGSSPGRKEKVYKNQKTAIAKDDFIPRSRFTTFNVDDSTVGNIQKAADWKRSKQLAESLTVPFPVDSWYAPNDLLWRENTLVTVESETLFIPDGFTFLIRSVEFLYGSEGTTAILNLVPPQVYTGEPIVEPWNPNSPQNFLEGLIAKL